MSEAYKRAQPGRLTFKGGDLATTAKSLSKKRKHKKPSKDPSSPSAAAAAAAAAETVASDAATAPGAAGAAVKAAEVGLDAYAIDAAKKMKYEELFPVEARKFGYDPANKERAAAGRVEQALDDRVKKKADRYCK